MSGWMEPAAWSSAPEVVRAVVPTVALPLATVAFVLNAIATAVAGWFGLDLKWEGPKRLLEVLLKPRVLLAALALNLVLWGAYSGYRYWRALPASLWRVERVNARLASAAPYDLSQRKYGSTLERENIGPAAAAGVLKPVQIGQAWRRKLPEGVFGNVALSGDSAFVGSDDGYVYELDRSTGQGLRKFFVGTEITPTPVVWRNQLIVGEGVHDSHHCRIYFFDLATGLFRGAFETQGHTEGQVVVAEHGGLTQVFVMAGADGVYAVDPVTLRSRWHLLPGHVDSEVKVADGLVFFATGIEKGYADRTHFAIAADFQTGKIVWKRELPASGWMPPLIVDRRVCFGSGEIYTSSQAGWLTCLDRSTGEPTQSATLDAPLASVPFLSGGAILVADLNGRLCSLSARDLGRNWCLDTSSKRSFASPVTDADGRILFLTEKAGLWVIDPQRGTILSQWMPTERQGKWAKAYGRVSVASDGWYLSDIGGNVRKLSYR